MIPSKYREQLFELSEGKLVFALDIHEPCIGIYTLNHFNELRTALMENRNASAAFRKVLRLMIGTAQNCEMDANGRLMVPKQLRTDVNIDREAVLIRPEQSRFELWAKGIWHEQYTSIQANASSDEETQELLRSIKI